MSPHYSGGGVIPMPPDTRLVALPTWLEIDLAALLDEDRTCTVIGCSRPARWIASCAGCGARPTLLPDGRRRVVCDKHRRVGDRHARRLSREHRRRGLRYVCKRCEHPLYPPRWVPL